ncbi:porphobilinogen deaminase [mine drainage metagenome]|uniref:hydroxymethylbilane synthase n=1 Tax=mine drainage metagenome TaxID=410659 RepID=A0A1J5SW75_9ZZZZ
MKKILRIGTRDSQLAVWQATLVQQLLQEKNIASELVHMKSEGDIDLVTPLYEMGVQGVFTKTLDAALLSNKFDIAVHSMKDVPTQLAKGIMQAAVLPRASYKDIFVFKSDISFLEDFESNATIATSSIRRKAQWLNRYHNHQIENLRGNVNTRLRKLNESNWNGAIFAAAGVERINLRPENSIELDWMLPAPAQGAITIVCRENDEASKEICSLLNDAGTALCTKIERDFLRTLLGGCSTPISALAEIKNDTIHFRGNIFSLDGKEKVEIEKIVSLVDAKYLGIDAGKELLNNGGKEIAEKIRNAGI